MHLKTNERPIHLITILACCFLVILFTIPAVHASGESVTDPGEVFSIDIFSNTLDHCSSLPDWDQPIQNGDNQVVIYDQDSNENPGRDIDHSKCCEAKHTNPGIPHTTLENSEWAYGRFSTGEYLEPPYSWPHTAVVKIITEWPSGESSHCSGVLIHENHVMTAGHCIYTHQEEHCSNGDPGCWANKVEVFSNYFDGEDGWEKAVFDQILTFTAWTNNRDFNYDLAVIRLDQTLGDTARGTGWLGFGFNDYDHFFENKNLEHLSYRCDENPPDFNLYRWQGSLSGIDYYRLLSLGPSLSGQNGAGLFDPGYHHIVFGVLSHGWEFEEEYYTGYTRLTSGTFIAITEWLEIESKDILITYYFPLFYND